MLMKWLNGKCHIFFFFLRKCSSVFLWFALTCAFMSCWRGSKVTTGWLFASFFSLPPGAVAEMQSHNNGCLFLLGKRCGGEGGVEVGKGAIGVYLSHGNWFAGVEVGSFEKTSFSLTPSHLSVWKAAGRKGRRMERVREEWRSADAEAFSYKGWRNWVYLKAKSDAGLKRKAPFCIPPKCSLPYSLSILLWCLMCLFACTSKV